MDAQSQNLYCEWPWLFSDQDFILWIPSVILFGKSKVKLKRTAWLYFLIVLFLTYSSFFLFLKNIFFFFATPCGLQDFSSPKKDWIQVMAVKAPHPNHWTTRELLDLLIIANQTPFLCRWHHPYGREQRRTKEPLDESERGEWKSWLKTQYSKN